MTSKEREDLVEDIHMVKEEIRFKTSRICQLIWEAEDLDVRINTLEEQKEGLVIELDVLERKLNEVLNDATNN